MSETPNGEHVATCSLALALCRRVLVEPCSQTTEIIWALVDFAHDNIQYIYLPNSQWSHWAWFTIVAL